MMDLFKWYHTACNVAGWVQGIFVGPNVKVVEELDEALCRKQRLERMEKTMVESKGNGEFVITMCGRY